MFSKLTYLAGKVQIEFSTLQRQPALELTSWKPQVSVINSIAKQS